MRTGQNIYKRKDGRWEARIPLGIRANGRRYFKCFYGKTYQEARNRKQDYEKNIPLTKEIVTTSPDTFSSSAYPNSETGASKCSCAEAADGKLE